MLDHRQVLGHNGGSDQDWAGSLSLFGCFGEKGSSKQHVRCRGGAGVLDQQLLKEKPGLLLLSNSAQDIRTWGRMLQGACCWRSFIYLPDLWPCLLLVGAAGWARSQDVLRHLCLLAQGMLSMRCLHGRLRGRLPAPPGTWFGSCGEQFRLLPHC